MSPICCNMAVDVLICCDVTIKFVIPKLILLFCLLMYMKKKTILDNPFVFYVPYLFWTFTKTGKLYSGDFCFLNIPHSTCSAIHLHKFLLAVSFCPHPRAFNMACEYQNFQLFFSHYLSQDFPLLNITVLFAAIFLETFWLLT